MPTQIAGAISKPKPSAKPTSPNCPTSNSGKPHGRLPSARHQSHCAEPTSGRSSARCSSFWSCDTRQVNELRPAPLMPSTTARPTAVCVASWRIGTTPEKYTAVLSTKAIVVVHYAGVACEMDAINDIAH